MVNFGSNLYFILGKPGGPLAGFDFKTFMQNVKKAKNNNTGKMSRKISHVSNKFEQDSGAENEDEDEDEEEMIWKLDHYRIIL